MFENDKDLVKGVHGVHGVKGVQGTRVHWVQGVHGVHGGHGGHGCPFTIHLSPSSLLSGGRRRCLLP